VRIGAHTGDVLYREGDYVGTNVNIAARIAALAQREQFIITDHTVAESTLADVQYIALGAQRLKGITQQIDAYAVQRSDEITQA
jgi:class 3 adenylate cyclase